ncbi:MAG: PTS sugar transporter subunit IIB [Anaerolineales bacterium]|nr:PTS sugar transporter subunit IIB [Anaerolineales bacterium]
MKKGISVVTICGCGMGSSLMLRINVEKLMKELGIEGTVEVADMVAGKGMTADIMVTTPDILKALGDTSRQFKQVVTLSNLVSKKVLRTELGPILEEMTANKT